VFFIATDNNPLWLNGERLALLVAGINYPRTVQGNADPHQFRTYFNYCLNY
jgi:hypothetical protein